MTNHKAMLGAALGVLFAVLWAAFGFGWACLALALGVLGAVIGHFADRPGPLIDLLQRLQER